jgi:hypothetical protein
MCRNRTRGSGLKRIFVLLVLSVFLVGSLSAVSWPWAWGKSESPAPEPMIIQEAVPEGMILLEESLWNELKAQLIEREKAQSDLKKSYEAELRKLKAEIATLTALSPISTEMHNALIVEKEALTEDLRLKTQESDAYYRRALEAPNKTGFVAGAGATYRIADGKYGAEIELGLRWDRTIFKVGVGYTPNVWAFAVPDPRDLVVKAGILHSF